MASRKPYPLLDRPWRRLRNYLRPHLMWSRITASEAWSLKTCWAWGEGKGLCVSVSVFVCVNRIVFQCVTLREVLCLCNTLAHITPTWHFLTYFLHVPCVCVKVRLQATDLKFDLRTNLEGDYGMVTSPNVKSGINPVAKFMKCFMLYLPTWTPIFTHTVVKVASGISYQC